MEERVVCGPVGIAPSVEMFATIWSAEPRLRFDHALALPYPSRIGRLCSVIRQSGGSGCIGLACRRTRWFGAIGRNNGIPVMISEQCAIPFFFPSLAVKIGASMANLRAKLFEMSRIQ